MHDVTMVKPLSETAVEEIKTPVKGLGWASRETWSSLRMQPSSLRILGSTETNRVIVGEGIFLNQTAAAGTGPLKDHDLCTWTKMVSPAVLYRINPDFDPPNGYSGIALYADGLREDGTHGPGVVGLQSFVQRTEFVRSFNVPEGQPMEQRLRNGRIAFYGAFQIPDDLRSNYTIV
jgi:hypothetical protein